MPHRATIFTGAYICTADDDDRIIPTGSILVVGERIAALGDEADVARVVEQLPPQQQAGLRRVDARGTMILPGLVNPHFHDLFLYRAKDLLTQPGYAGEQPGIFSNGGNVALLSRAFDTMHGLVAGLRSDEAVAIARFSLWTQLRCGITTVGEVGSLNRPDATIDALRFLGMRGAVNRWIADGYCDPDSGEYRRTRSVDETVAALDEVAEMCSAQPADQVRFMASTIYSLNMSDELGERIADLVRTRDARFATHVAALANEPGVSTKAFGRSPVRRFAELGLLNDRLLAVHCAFLDEAEQELVRERGVHVCMAPAKYGTTGETTMNGNELQFLRFKRAGVNLSVSTDGEGVPVPGQIESMRMAWLPQNELAADDTAVLPTEALTMATRDAAAALGWRAEIGSLEVGKQADLIQVPIDDWRYLLVGRPLESFLKMANYRDVQTVMIRGRVAIEGGRACGFDEGELESAAVDATLSFVARTYGNADALKHAYASRYGHRPLPAALGG